MFSRHARFLPVTPVARFSRFWFHVMLAGFSPERMHDLVKGSMMAEITLLTGRLIAAARVLTGVSRAELARACGISVPLLTRLEASGSAVLGPQVDAQALRRALEGFGAMFIPESDGIGAGVRLRFLRQDVKQIGRMENEGGNVADDDVP